MSTEEPLRNTSMTKWKEVLKTEQPEGQDSPQILCPQCWLQPRHNSGFVSEMKAEVQNMILMMSEYFFAKSISANKKYTVPRTGFVLMQPISQLFCKTVQSCSSYSVGKAVVYYQLRSDIAWEGICSDKPKLSHFLFRLFRDKENHMPVLSPVCGLFLSVDAVWVPDHPLEYSLRKPFKVNLEVYNMDIRRVWLSKEDLGSSLTNVIRHWIQQVVE